MSLEDIIFNIFISITASFVFWILTFKISFTKIVFANFLVKSDNTLTNSKKAQGYRFRVANVGIRDLIEVTIVAKLIIKDFDRSHICELDISNSGTEIFVTDFPGSMSHKFKDYSNIKTLTLYPSKSMNNELSKRIYPKRIQKYAKKGKIGIQDIFEEYGNNALITIYLYGNDKTTGARKMYKSPGYTINEVQEGEFLGSKKIKIPFIGRAKTKRDMISQLYKTNTIKN